jgi:transposase
MVATNNKRTKTILVGLDVSAKTLHVVTDVEDGVREFSNDSPGHKKLAKLLTKRGHSARIVMESTGSYHFDLACFLHDHRRCEVMVVNPRESSHFQKACGIRAKTDKVDATSLLHFAKVMEFVPWRKPSMEIIHLRSSARYVDQLKKHRAALKNQLHAAGVTSTTPTWVIDDLRSQIEHLDQQVKLAAAKTLEFARSVDAIAPHVERLKSMPGIGYTTAIGMLAEFLPLDPSMTSNQITAWAGLDPRPKESGTSVRGRRSISRRGSSRMRRILYFPAITAVRKDGPFKDLHERVSQRSGHKMVGITAVMRKILITAWAIFRTERPWEARLASPRGKVLIYA